MPRFPPGVEIGCHGYCRNIRVHYGYFSACLQLSSQYVNNDDNSKNHIRGLKIVNLTSNSFHDELRTLCQGKDVLDD